eukprot:scaffold2514_cov373-Prasinococcus_capsulatus_cf.AAC.14
MPQAACGTHCALARLGATTCLSRPSVPGWHALCRRLSPRTKSLWRVYKGAVAVGPVRLQQRT